jgi:hypothetical protein
MPSHTHDTSGFYTAGGSGSTNYTSGSPTLNKAARPTASTGGDDAHNNVQPSRAALVVIKT